MELKSAAHIITAKEMNDWRKKVVATGRMPIGLDIEAFTGLKRLGSGFYSSVFEHPDDVNLVIKISCKATEDGWKEFAEYTRANPSVIFPVIGEIDECENCYVVVMERLHRMYHYNDMVDEMDEPEDQVGYMANVEGVDYEQSWLFDSIVVNLRGLASYNSLFTQVRKLVEWSTWDLDSLKEYKTLIVDGVKMWKHFNNINATDDLHAGNVMMRGDQLVITDPIS